MKRFLELVDLMRSDGLVTRHEGHAVHLLPEQIPSGYWDSIAECQPFVFDLKESENGPMDPDLIETSAGPIDAPFKVFSIEVMGEHTHIAVPRPSDTSKTWMDCIVVIEVEPKKYVALAMIRHGSPSNAGRVALVHPGTNMGGAESIYQIIKLYIDRLAVEKTGVEENPLPHAIKIGHKKTQRYHRIKRLIHVMPKKAVATYAPGHGRQVEWTHRWAVRGHWRKVTTLGKDREGNYCVEGWTWISEHVRGPETAPLVQKVRLVKEPAPAPAPDHEEPQTKGRSSGG
jgi:hypothetical protein